MVSVAGGQQMDPAEMQRMIQQQMGDSAGGGGGGGAPPNRMGEILCMILETPPAPCNMHTAELTAMAMAHHQVQLLQQMLRTMPACLPRDRCLHLPLVALSLPL